MTRASTHVLPQALRATLLAAIAVLSPVPVQDHPPTTATTPRESPTTEREPMLPLGASSDWWRAAQARIEADSYHVWPSRPGSVGDASGSQVGAGDGLAGGGRQALSSALDSGLDVGSGSSVASDSDSNSNLPDISREPRSFEGVNARHGWRAQFAPDGLLVEPVVPTESADPSSEGMQPDPRELRGDAMRVGADPTPAWTLGLRLAAIGAGATLESVPEPTTHASGSRVELAYGAETPDAAPLVEWYVNEARGLEHGFVVREAPTGDGPLTLALQVTGGWCADANAAGDGVALTQCDPVSRVSRPDAGSPRLTYKDLHVYDAHRRVLSARLEVPAHDSASMRIVVMGSDAVYPITIDPILSGPTPTLDGQTDDWFGYSVGTAGDVNGDGFSDVVVGAPSVEGEFGHIGLGRAYVFLGSAGGLSGTPARTWTGEATGSGFGRVAGTAGDVNGDGYSDVIVTSPRLGNGRAYVYHGSAAGPSLSPVWTLTGNSGEALGFSASAAGDVDGDGYSDVVIGATGLGRAYVVHGGPSGLDATPTTTLSGEGTSDEFGRAVSAGDVNGDGFADIVVGAPYYHFYDLGRAYVFYGGSSGVSTTAAASLTGEADGDYFGRAVAAVGDVNGDGYTDVAIGSSNYDADDRGRAYVFLGGSGGLASTPASTFTGEGTDNYLGAAVSGAGDVDGDGFSDVIIGAFGYSLNTGRVYLYRGQAAGLVLASTLTGSGSGVFGSAVGAAGDVNGDGHSDVIIGDRLANPQAGRAYIYMGSSGGLATTSSPTLTGASAQDRFGGSVASAGDINGDGYGDVIVGAWGYSSFTGRAYLYLGGATGLAATPAWTLTGEGGEFGRSVASAGDVNGDGYDDVVIGARDLGPGRAYVFLGASGGLQTSAHRTWIGTVGNFGWSVSGAGDLNGDGYSEVVVGEPSGSGRVHIYAGSALGLPSTPFATVVGVGGEELGDAVAAAGDVNRDGYADLVVGAPSHGGNYGRAYVFHGSANGLATSPARTLDGEAISFFGNAVSTAGDLNGDGYADIVVGARAYNNDQGRAYVFHGSSSGTLATASVTLTGAAGSRFGWAVATAGDVNGDGYGDVAIGSPYHSSSTGRVEVFAGGSGGLTTTALATFDGEGGQFGHAVASAGDVNGDGYAELVAGALGYSGNQGRVYVFAGNASLGRAVRPRTRRADDTAPIVRGGQSESRTSFRLAASAYSPYGRTKVGLQWEVKPLGTSFDGTDLGQSAWVDTSTAGVALNALVSALSENTRYHWRIRLAYDPADAPPTFFSRWMTQPTGGWQLAALSTAPNSAPVATAVSVTGVGSVGQTLSGSFTYSDLDGDAAGTHQYRWLRNGAPIAGATASGYTVTPADTGQTLTVEVTPIALTGLSPGLPATSPGVVIQNSAPTASAVNVSGTPLVGRTLSGSFVFGDVDGDLEGTALYRWLRDGSPIDGATSTTYTLVAADMGRALTFKVTPVALTGVLVGTPATSAAVSSVVRYFAEGATSEFFSTRFALLNPDNAGATVQLHFDKSDGTRVTYPLMLAAHASATVDMASVPGMSAAQFSTSIESDRFVVVDRTMAWDGTQYGAHAETSVAAPSTTWFLAEGATHSGFSLFYLIQNPQAAAATVHVRYLLPTGVPVERDYTVAPRSRFNIWVNHADPALAATDVSAVFTSDQPIIVERAMYLSRPGQVFEAGHESAAVTAPATEWFLAEGATGPYFDLFVLVANATNLDAAVQVSYLLPDGNQLMRSHVVPANSRFNIWVDLVDPLLADTAVSTVVTSTNGVPIIVERSMWWPGSGATWAEAHNSLGLRSLGSRWALADGEVGGIRNAQTFILIANRGSQQSAEVTLYFEDGTTTSRVFTLLANSRTNVAVGSEFPSAAGRRFGATVRAIGGAGQLAVERAMYWDAGGVSWAAGTNAVGTPLP